MPNIKNRWSMAKAFAATSFAFSLTACSNYDNIFTLYRNSPIEPNMRIHIATFDAKSEHAGYNRENCNIAQGLFSKQPGVSVRYWCERGRNEE